MTSRKVTDPDSFQQQSPAPRKARKGKAFQQVLEGEFLTRTSVIRNLPYLVFLTIIALTYIGHTFYAEKTFKDIERTKKVLKELRYRYITTKSKLMYLSKQTEVAGRAAALGLATTPVPPYKIYYSRNANSNPVKP